MRSGSFERDPTHPSWINTSVTVGEPVRVFGRSLAWDGPASCIGAAGPKPGGVATTRLSVAGVENAASSANCFEATFPTDGMAAGWHPEATVSTPWGAVSFGLTILPPVQPPAPTTIDVTKDFAGNLLNALAHAATLPASTPKVVALGAATTYTLTRGVSIPANTTILGAGAASSHIEFAVPAPDPKRAVCGALQPGLDFYKEDCDPAKEHCFRDIAEFDNTTASSAHNVSEILLRGFGGSNMVPTIAI